MSTSYYIQYSHAFTIIELIAQSTLNLVMTPEVKSIFELKGIS